MFRWLDRLYAWFWGYFWLPCPVCREEFGGHEASHRALLTDDGQHAYITCSKPECVEEADRRNASNPHSHGVVFGDPVELARLREVLARLI